MTVLGAFVYYIGVFIVILCCAIGGVILGKTLKDKKLSKDKTEKNKLNNE